MAETAGCGLQDLKYLNNDRERKIPAGCLSIIDPGRREINVAECTIFCTVFLRCLQQRFQTPNNLFHCGNIGICISLRIVQIGVVCALYAVGYQDLL